MLDFDDEVTRAVEAALREDLGPEGDITCSLIWGTPSSATGSFVAREDGVVAGSAAVAETFRQVGGNALLRWSCNDGDFVQAGTRIADVFGELRPILAAERTALNFMCHLSGVATATRKFVDLAPGVGIRDTRKTTPGLRWLEKAAVRAGGGVNHRFCLSDAVLIKDNHLTGISITQAVERALDRYPTLPVEVECDREEQVVEAVAAGAPMVLLDNMSPEQVKRCAEIAHAKGVTVEVSGRVNLANVAEYAKAGTDLISVGSITHSAAILDIGLDLQPQDGIEHPLPQARTEGVG